MLETAKKLVVGEKGPQAGSGLDVEDVLSKLTLEEKIALLSGIDFWHTAPVHRLGIPSVRLSDGPNGIRGTRFFNSVPAACLPCGTSLAATWDEELVKKGGVLQGTEAIAKGASVILGPTVNIQRSPLGGRGFESFSEDPFLSGVMAAATVNGIQSTGVAATIKHFVANDQEHERQACNSIVTQRALREIYLMPFQIAQRDAKPVCLMTAYNRVNGIHVSESLGLLKRILRGEWGYDGLVMSDWFGTYSTTEAVKAGLDLEMPASSNMRGGLIKQALACQKLHVHDLDLRVREILKLVKIVEPLGIPENAPENTIDSEETAKLLRQLSSNGIVLMKNENNVLPFGKDKSTAVIGPNADIAAYCGGGSASLNPYYAVTPLEGIKAQAKNVKYRLGAPGWKKMPFCSRLTKTPDGREGFTMRVYLDPPSVPDREQIDEIYVKKSDILLADYKNPRIKSILYYAELEGVMTPEETAEYGFSLSVTGTGKIFVDGNLVVDNETHQTPGDSFFGFGTIEETGSIRLQADKSYRILIQYGTSPTMKFQKGAAMGAGGLRVGCARKTDQEIELAAAVELAKSVDQVIVCAGLNSDWESEGYDRQHMDLPPGSDELISAVTAANPRTAVVIQSGTPVDMRRWLSATPALLQAWYGGNETGNAIADVLFGKTNPSGKLPLSFPLRVSDNPAFLNYRSARGRVLYGEDVFVGYRFYEASERTVAFPFGHGLSYSRFSMDSLSVSPTSLTNPVHDATITVQLSITNHGPYPGSDVVQVYVSQRDPTIPRPPKELKGFCKISPGVDETRSVTVSLSARHAASFWDEDRDAWIVESGVYDVWVGDSSVNVPLKTSFEIQGGHWWWTGL